MICDAHVVSNCEDVEKDRVKRRYINKFRKNVETSGLNLISECFHSIRGKRSKTESDTKDLTVSFLLSSLTNFPLRSILT